MLSIGLVSGGQQKYYTDLSREDYYTSGGEPAGKWFGKGAKTLGLDGTVQKEHFENCFSGKTPDGEQSLRRSFSTDKKKSRAAYDLTFNAPKSVSVLFSQVDDETRKTLQEAQEEAVRAALAYVESEAGEIRLGKNGVDVREAGVTAALYEHSTSRIVPGEEVSDPHLHTHAVVMNFGIDADGRSATLNSRELFHHKMSAGVLYRAELFRQIERRLGLKVFRGEKFCELEAVPKDLLEHFSKRRAQIEEEMQRQGVTEYGTATSSIALKTRTTKPRVDRAAFIAEWQRVGREFGFQVSSKLFEGALSQAPERDVPALVDTAISEAVQKVTEQHAHFAEREFVRALGDLLEDKGVGAEAILAGARSYFRTRDLVKVGRLKGEDRYTTREMLALERRMFRKAEELHRQSHRVCSQTLDRVVASRPTISAEQRAALSHVTQGRRVALVEGIAGAGKTYMLAAARESWEAEGYQVIGAALAGTAAKGLQEGAGIKSSTIHRLLYDLRDGKRKLTSRSVIVVDEAGMVGTRMTEELVRRAAKARAKIVLVGDSRQLQSIEAGAGFTGLVRKFGAAEMEEIRRQKEEWAKKAVREFSRGEAREALRRFAARGLIKVDEFKADSVRALTEDYLTAASEVGFEEVLALTGTRSDARKVNHEVQLTRRARGELGEDSIELNEETFRAGDRVIFRKNCKLLSVLNGERGQVVSIHEDRMVVQVDGGKRVSVHEEMADRVLPQLGYSSTTHSSQGATVDRCLVLAGGHMQDREATYVQASRAREETRIYVDELTAGGEEFEALSGAMSRSRRKDLATDLLPDQAYEEGQALDLR